MINIKYLLPTVPTGISLYLVVSQYLYYKYVLAARLNALGIYDFHTSLSTNSPDILKQYAQYTFIFLAISFGFLVITCLNAFLFKKERLYNLWVIYCAIALVAIFSITKHFTTINNGYLSYQELQSKDRIIDRLQKR